VTLYSEGFRNRMIERLSGPNPMSATALAAEVGVSQATLSRWLKEAATVGRKMHRSRDQENPSAASTKPTKPSPSTRRPQDWTAEEKVALVLETAAVPAVELGELLRRRGVHEAQLAEWRTQATQGAVAALQGPSRRDRKAANLEARRVRELERELARKEKALAEAAALLVLKKKAQAIWGAEDDDMDPRNDE
jgi:transposase